MEFKENLLIKEIMEQKIFLRKKEDLCNFLNKNNINQDSGIWKEFKTLIKMVQQKIPRENFQLLLNLGFKQHIKEHLNNRKDVDWVINWSRAARKNIAIAIIHQDRLDLLKVLFQEISKVDKGFDYNYCLRYALEYNKPLILEFLVQEGMSFTSNVNREYIWESVDVEELIKRLIKVDALHLIAKPIDMKNIPFTLTELINKKAGRSFDYLLQQHSFQYLDQLSIYTSQQSLFDRIKDSQELMTIYNKINFLKEASK